ncbi:hypothetical protein SARC_07532 [Sphaeroforma arctica JP610]|uniref:G-patch domain-containing protein n=1 Tax=Sphaeroforma arctica JP610 TaxID=667725 RepID=A0A0L0FTW9_9EUKA|nr:hypothetical protein SARC_07532 [Sphaeroforma arctica JP610]KNC80089.1 hypothetical protein SARC_07532 [Sphaeroforma arctica JP610]|eukprot:XP_014153991.1 hypothetical protein SARC_07532 [Sphaeroforma arctica JP610]
MSSAAVVAMATVPGREDALNTPNTGCQTTESVPVHTALTLAQMYPVSVRKPKAATASTTKQKQSKGNKKVNVASHDKEGQKLTGKQRRKLRIEAKRMDRADAKGFDIGRINSQIIDFVESKGDLHAFDPMASSAQKLVCKLARMYRLDVSICGSNKKRIVMVRYTTRTSLPGDDGPFAQRDIEELIGRHITAPSHAEVCRRQNADLVTSRQNRKAKEKSRRAKRSQGTHNVAREAGEGVATIRTGLSAFVSGGVLGPDGEYRDRNRDSQADSGTGLDGEYRDSVGGSDSNSDSDDDRDNDSESGSIGSGIGSLGAASSRTDEEISGDDEEISGDDEEISGNDEKIGGKDEEIRKVSVRMSGRRGNGTNGSKGVGAEEIYGRMSPMALGVVDTEGVSSSSEEEVKNAVRSDIHTTGDEISETSDIIRKNGDGISEPSNGLSKTGDGITDTDTDRIAEDGMDRMRSLGEHICRCDEIDTQLHTYTAVGVAHTCRDVETRISIEVDTHTHKHTHAHVATRKARREQHRGDRARTGVSTAVQARTNTPSLDTELHMSMYTAAIDTHTHTTLVRTSVRTAPTEPHSSASSTAGDSSISAKSATHASGVGTFEQHTRGIGSKLMGRMGYVSGEGLGPRHTGIRVPILAAFRPKNIGLGAKLVKKST